MPYNTFPLRERWLLYRREIDFEGPQKRDWQLMRVKIQ